MKVLQILFILLILVIGQIAMVIHAAEFKITAREPDAWEDARFGTSVAISGDYAIVGAYLSGYDDLGSSYVFVRNGETWTEQAKLTASDGTKRDFFGISVAISGDYAIVGAHRDHSGSAYIFVRNGENWTEQAKLTASDALGSDQFGISVAISGDYAIVGDHTYDGAGVNSGSSYVFVRNGEIWTEQAKLTASDIAAGDLFGSSVSISGDYAIVGLTGTTFSQVPRISSGATVRPGSSKRNS